MSNSLPDFLIIGAQRSGTTSLYELLCRHSKVSPATRKELHYFDRKYHCGEGDYGQFFSVSETEITGEATPYYLFHRQVPPRVKIFVPNVRLIALLRDPVDRAYSQYHFNRRKRQEPLDSFEAAIDAEESRLQAIRDRLSPVHQDPYDHLEFSAFSYLARGRYAEQLERWLIQFDRAQLLLIKSEYFYSNAERVLPEVHSHLGIPTEEITSNSDFQPELVKGHMGEYKPMKEETRARLARYFAPHNKRLYAMLGRDFGWYS